MDGLTSEFYKSCSEDLAPFLLEVFCESIDKEVPPPTLSLITLIPKPKKDFRLLNNGYKTSATTFAKRIKNVLNNIIAEVQTGFMRNRHISNSIRLVLHILDFSRLD